MPMEGSRAELELVSCPICIKVFNEKEQRPISLRCGHSVCKSCLKHNMTVRRCPFDQEALPADNDDLPSNFALMQLIGAVVPHQTEEEDERKEDEVGRTEEEVDQPECYKQACKCVVDMAAHLKPLVNNGSDDDSDSGSEMLSSHSPHRSATPSKSSHCVLSRPMQRKLISLVHCQLQEEEGRSRAARIARSLGERVVSELLLLHQFPHQLSANLWAAVRTRGCQFLGPAMQEEVLKLILLALEDGSFLSRKVLVLFVVQKLEGKYPQASKTAIGHVVQLLYRASCFKVMKRDEESSLMQLKSEFCQYEALRREHDSQIVQIALEAGLRISPEQWSSLLYGDSAHKSHMQSIIDKHQSPQSFSQSLIELLQTLERVGDPKHLHRLHPQLEFLSNIDPSPDCPALSWENLEAVMRSLRTVVQVFVDFISSSDHRQRLETTPMHNARYKTSKCRDFALRGSCPRGNTCTFAHSQEELDRYRSRSRRSGQRAGMGEKTTSSLTPAESDQLRQVQLLSRLKLDSVQSAVREQVSPTGARETEGGMPTDRSSTNSQGSPNVSPSATYNWHSPPPQHHHQPPGPTNTNILRGLEGGKALTQQQAPYFPLGVHHMPPTHLTFSRPNIDGHEAVRACHPGHQTAYHPNSSSTFYPQQPPPSFQPPPGKLHPDYPTANHALQHVHHDTEVTYSQSSLMDTPTVVQSSASQCEGTGVRVLPDGYGSMAGPMVSCMPRMEANGSHLPPQGMPYMIEGKKTPPGVSTPPTRSVAELSSPQSRSLVDLACQSQLLRDPTCGTRPRADLTSQTKTLADLTSQKREIIWQLQEDPVFMDQARGPSLYKADSRKGFHGLKTVLQHNKNKTQAMPKVVSDMFVATRSTQSLDQLLDEEWTDYNHSWSNGMDRGCELDVEGTSPTPSAYSMPQRQDVPVSVYQAASQGYSIAKSIARSGNTVFPTTFLEDSEFSSFPYDEDDTFIPFEQTKSSRFGPISRLSKTSQGNTKPVQVTAESCEKMTPVLAVTPLERPRTTSMTVVSRFNSPGRLVAEPAVKPTPMEAPSVWQQSPHPSYQNIAGLKAGAGQAVSNNERLAYELQAVELEIAMKTGQAPEPVSRMLQEAVSNPHPGYGHSSVRDSHGGDLGHSHGYSNQGTIGSEGSSWGQGDLLANIGLGHVTEQLVLDMSDNPVSPQLAAQRLLDDYGRSWRGPRP